MPDISHPPAPHLPLSHAEARRLLRPLLVPSAIFCLLLAVLTLNADPQPLSPTTLFWNSWESFGTGFGVLGFFVLLAPPLSRLLRVRWSPLRIRIAIGLVALLLAQLAVNATVVLFAPPERGTSTWVELLLNWLVLGLVTSVVFLLVERAQAELAKGREAVRRNALLGQELALAQEIQSTLIPRQPPDLAGLELASGYYAAREVGGDLLSYQALPDGSLSLSIGDVTGKSMPAAMLMGVTLGALQAAQRGDQRPAAVLDAIDAVLRAQIGGRRFVALSHAVIDPARRRLVIANAGQLDPILRRGADASFIELPPAMPLGVGPPAAKRELEIALEPGDALVFYTDGVAEAHNPAGELFGFERLLALVRELPASASAAAMHQAIIEAVRAWAAGAEAHDDITVIAVRLPGAPAASQPDSCAQDRRSHPAPPATPAAPG